MTWSLAASGHAADKPGEEPGSAERAMLDQLTVLLATSDCRASSVTFTGTHWTASLTPGSAETAPARFAASIRRRPAEPSVIRPGDPGYPQP